MASRKKKDSSQFPIEWYFGERVETKFANNMLVQFDPSSSSFFLSFFEVQPPVLFGTPEQRKKALGNLKSIRANCVARIAVPKARMKNFIDAMKSNLDRSTKVTEIELKDKSNVPIDSKDK